MKILYSTYKWAFQHPGGGEEIILRLKDCLERRGHEVHLFNPWQDRVTEFDLVHEFSLVDWRYWDLYQANQIPFVLTPTSWPRKDIKFRLKLYSKFLIDKARHKDQVLSLMDSLKIPDIILPTTSLERDRLLEVYRVPLNKMKVINNGVDYGDFMDEASFKNEFGEKPFLLFVANITPNKNLHIALEIAKRLKIKIRVVGSMEKDPHYVKKCKNISGVDVEFLGFVKDKAKLNSLYQHCQAVLIPSDFETCSLVALEAGLAGAKVALTRHGGTREIFKDRVTYIDPKKLEYSIIQVQNLLTQEKSDRLKRHVETHYLWDKIGEKVEKIYQRVAAKGHYGTKSL